MKRLVAINAKINEINKERDSLLREIEKMKNNLLRENLSDLAPLKTIREETYRYLHLIVMIDSKVNSLRFVENGMAYRRDDYQLS